MAVLLPIYIAIIAGVIIVAAITVVVVAPGVSNVSIPAVSPTATSTYNFSIDGVAFQYPTNFVVENITCASKSLTSCLNVVPTLPEGVFPLSLLEIVPKSLAGDSVLSRLSNVSYMLVYVISANSSSEASKIVANYYNISKYPYRNGTAFSIKNLSSQGFEKSALLSTVNPNGVNQPSAFYAGIARSGNIIFVLYSFSIGSNFVQQNGEAVNTIMSSLQRVPFNIAGSASNILFDNLNNITYLFGRTSIKAINTTTNTMYTVFTTSSNNANVLGYGAVDTNNGYIYFTEPFANVTGVFDPYSNSIIKNIASGPFPSAITFDPLNNYVYVLNGYNTFSLQSIQNGSIAVINASSNKLIKTINIGNVPNELNTFFPAPYFLLDGITVDTYNSNLYLPVSNATQSKVLIVNTSSGSVSTIILPDNISSSNTYDAVFDSVTDKVYVSTSFIGSPAVLVLNTLSNTINTSFFIVDNYSAFNNFRKNGIVSSVPINGLFFNQFNNTLYSLSSSGMYPITQNYSYYNYSYIPLRYIYSLSPYSKAFGLPPLKVVYDPESSYYYILSGYNYSVSAIYSR